LTPGFAVVEKAILRASGFKPLHDETMAFSEATADAKKKRETLR